MASKQKLQDILKEKYGINKNISQTLNTEELERIVSILEKEPSVIKLVEAFSEKNQNLWKNNANLGRRRSQAEKEKSQIEREKEDLHEVKLDLEKDNRRLKNIVDQIRLLLAGDIRKILQYQSLNKVREELVTLLRKVLG
jgi:hypothetical protein